MLGEVISIVAVLACSMARLIGIGVAFLCERVLGA